MADQGDHASFFRHWQDYAAGKEREGITRHGDTTLATDLDIHFCDPHKPWQRGSNENADGLLRQYFPKSTDLTVHAL